MVITSLLGMQSRESSAIVQGYGNIVQWMKKILGDKEEKVETRFKKCLKPQYRAYIDSE